MAEDVKEPNDWERSAKAQADVLEWEAQNKERKIALSERQVESNERHTEAYVQDTKSAAQHRKQAENHFTVLCKEASRQSAALERIADALGTKAGSRG